MSEPFTIQFGPWSPDLQNVAVQLPYQIAPTPIPCADCLNVFYQDGAFRCLPSPESIGAPLTEQCFSAYSWYDQVEDQQIVFQGSVNTLYAFIDGASTAVPVENANSVAATPLSLNVRISGTNLAATLPLGVTLGSFAVLGGQLFHGTLKVGTSNSSSQTILGYVLSTLGSLTPQRDALGNLISAMEFITQTSVNTGAVSYFVQLKISATLTQSYFTTLKFPLLNASFASNTAAFSTSGGLSNWTWKTKIGFVSGGTYTMEIIR